MKPVYSFTEPMNVQGFFQIDENQDGNFLLQTCTGGAHLASFVRMSELDLRELQSALNDRFPKKAK